MLKHPINSSVHFLLRLLFSHPLFHTYLFPPTFFHPPFFTHKWVKAQRVFLLMHKWTEYAAAPSVTQMDRDAAALSLSLTLSSMRVVFLSLTRLFSLSELFLSVSLSLIDSFTHRNLDYCPCEQGKHTYSRTTRHQLQCSTV